MEQQSRPHWSAPVNDASRRLAQLAHVRTLVEEIAGTRLPAPEQAFDSTARIGAAYEAALPIAQKRFDILAAETALWAAAAAEALLDAGEAAAPRRAPAACLAAELVKAQRQMETILGL